MKVEQGADGKVRYPNRTSLAGTAKTTLPIVAHYKREKGWKHIYNPHSILSSLPMQNSLLVSYPIPKSLFLCFHCVVCRNASGSGDDDDDDVT